MSLPREPRQKMINMMYLVLTALLALNVSSEILNAFKTVNRSLETTNTTVNNSTKTILTSLEEKKSDPSPATSQKATIWFDKAKQIESQSKTIFDFITGIKNQILTEAGGNPNDPTQKFKEDNMDISTRILVEKGKGKELLAKLGDYKKNVLAVDPAINAQFANSLQIDLTKPPSTAKSSKTWEGAYFHMVPTVAAMTILSKFQNDIRTTENKLVSFCHEQVGRVEYKFDAYKPIVGQSSKYLMPGQELEITAGLGAFSKKNLPDIYIAGNRVTLDEEGIANYKMPGGGNGAHKVPVVVKFIDQEGNPQEKKYDVEYTVGQANASIALDEMNVLYIGYDNKVTIAASGAGSDKISASISSGSLISQGGGKYIAKVNSVTDDLKITVSVDGKVAGVSQFRVRTIPQPVGTVGGYASGDNVPAGAFKAQSGVGAYIKDFPLALKYSVTSFTITADDPATGDILEENVTGNLWTPRAASMVKGLSAGRMVTIDNLRAQGPDGRVQKLPSLVYYIK